ncbi:hypothetical protein AG1IA_09668 [Rhizoctonia solani AG-1 IA]|uniref:Uncharacterized protein n=1 Tax=Thanatephorus cucumeris (strain AG1-IA) TaxID=983506 RepID=L8WHW7_THACA|nr:hypothetical protein AG1IA_09668 [Rhizoctonia solani AG-1 IA]
MLLHWVITDVLLVEASLVLSRMRFSLSISTCISERNWISSKSIEVFKVFNLLLCRSPHSHGAFLADEQSADIAGQLGSILLSQLVEFKLAPLRVGLQILGSGLGALALELLNFQPNPYLSDPRETLLQRMLLSTSQVNTQCLSAIGSGNHEFQTQCSCNSEAVVGLVSRNFTFIDWQHSDQRATAFPDCMIKDARGYRPQLVHENYIRVTASELGPSRKATRSGCFFWCLQLMISKYLPGGAEPDIHNRLSDALSFLLLNYQSGDEVTLVCLIHMNHSFTHRMSTRLLVERWYLDDDPIQAAENLAWHLEGGYRFSGTFDTVQVINILTVIVDILVRNHTVGNIAVWNNELKSRQVKRVIFAELPNGRMSVDAVDDSWSCSTVSDLDGKITSREHATKNIIHYQDAAIPFWCQPDPLQTFTGDSILQGNNKVPAVDLALPESVYQYKVQRFPPGHRLEIIWEAWCP